LNIAEPGTIVARKKRQKLRTEFRKNREVRTRQNDLTRQLGTDQAADADQRERVSGKGRITRKRTVAGADFVEDEAGSQVLPEIDRTVCRQGRVLRVQGLVSRVRDEEGRIYSCAIRRLLKSLSTDQRHVVAAGDEVWFRPEGDEEGIIERVEPRHGILCRTSRGRQHIIVANVEQLVIVTSAAEPRIKPNLIDRMLITAERADIRPLVCINKIDLIDAVSLLPMVGVYSQLGYEVILVSATTGQNVEQLRERVVGSDSVLAGQSGVGKSSLLNVIEPGLHRKVQQVSEESQKGKHTTTTAELIPLADGGHVIDTPGIRQFQLWDVIPEEVAGYFPEMRPYVSRCRYASCTHTHEDDCAVKDAVTDHRIDLRRYESYMQIHLGEEAS
jgi:ribosome biogenesis GTPase / thiamine phosphate phosphatase